MTKPMQAANWNRPDDDYSAAFFDQNYIQIWTEKEIALNDDVLSWNRLSPEGRRLYKKVLGGLTFLDTEQGSEGMPLIMQHLDSQQKKAVLAIMCFMEFIHARSYSSIFTTLASTEEIDEIFQWVQDNPLLQRKGRVVSSYYRNIDTGEALYLALATSVILESGLFYSGFYYPLYLAGLGEMVASGEVVSLIIRDEAIHGQYVGTLAQDIYEQLTTEERASVDREIEQLVTVLYDNEYEYTKELYSEMGMVDDVMAFVRYNFNRAMMNLGRDPEFVEEEINPIVLNGMSTATKNHDFFSVKGNGYQLAVNIVPLTDEDFIFN
jgi:ribonucleoside-diphosphate reductase beta chain